MLSPAFAPPDLTPFDDYGILLPNWAGRVRSRSRSASDRMSIRRTTSAAQVCSTPASCAPITPTVRRNTTGMISTMLRPSPWTKALTSILYLLRIRAVSSVVGRTCVLRGNPVHGWNDPGRGLPARPLRRVRTPVRGSQRPLRGLALGLALATSSGAAGHSPVDRKRIRCAGVYHMPVFTTT